MNGTVSLSELLPADVLLYSGSGLISVDESQLEALVATYLNEVRAEPDMAARSLSEGASIEELSASASQFAATLFEATRSDTSRGIESTSALGSRTPVNVHLFQTAADFITPADLYRTQSLFLLGRLETAS